MQIRSSRFNIGLDLRYNSLHMIVYKRGGKIRFKDSANRVVIVTSLVGIKHVGHTF